MTRTLAIVLEGVGVSGIIAGISIECVMHADIGYMCITGGSLVVAIGGMIFAKFFRWSKN